MKLIQECQISAEPERVWAFMMDVPAVASCIPGVDEPVRPVDGAYEGVLRVRIGIVSVRLAGTIEIEQQDHERRQAALRAAAKALGGGGHLRAHLGMRLAAIGERETALRVETDVAFFGRLGELGLPLIRRTADSMMRDFTRNVERRLAKPA